MSTQTDAKPSILWTETSLWIGLASMAVMVLYGERLCDSSFGPAWWHAVLFGWLFVAMMLLAFLVVRHAECLASMVGEPYGTLILTLSVISVEVVLVVAVMLTKDTDPTMARETMFATLMIILNGMVGLMLLVGGIRHREQAYNLQAASAYLSVLVPMAILGLVLPRFTTSAPGGYPSPLIAGFLIVVSIGLYGTFLGIQTIRHRSYFDKEVVPEQREAGGREHEHFTKRSVPVHAGLLLTAIATIVILAEKFAVVLQQGLETIHAPEALEGFFVALLICSPETLGAARAALCNRVQRAINICLGSAYATIGLTIPAVLAVGMFTGHAVELGLEEVEYLLLITTLLVSMVSFSSGHTNVLQGVVHLVLFFSYVILIFD